MSRTYIDTAWTGDPLSLGFEKIMARFDRLEFMLDSMDRRVDKLGMPRIPYPGPPYFSDEADFDGHRSQRDGWTAEEDAPWPFNHGWRDSGRGIQRRHGDARDVHNRGGRFPQFGVATAPYRSRPDMRPRSSWERPTDRYPQELDRGSQHPTRFRTCYEQPPGWPPPQCSPPSCWPAQRRQDAYRQQHEPVAAHMESLNRFSNSPAATTQSRSCHEQPTVVLQPLLSPTSLQRSAIPPIAYVAVPSPSSHLPIIRPTTQLVSCEEMPFGVEGDSRVLNQVDLRLNEKKVVDEEVQAIEVDKIVEDEGHHDSSKAAALNFDGCLAKTYVKGVNADTWSPGSPSIPEKLHNRYKDELHDAREGTINGLKDMSIYSRMGVKRMGELDNKPFHVTIMRKFVEEVYIEYTIVGYWRLKQQSCPFDPGGDNSPQLLRSTLRCFVVSTLRTRWILTVGELLRAYYYYYLV